jgi:dCTP deaminase
MVLSDNEIRSAIKYGGLGFKPPVEDDQIQPASVDLRLGRGLLVEGDDGVWDEAPIENGQVEILPGILYLGTTLERVEIPSDLLGILCGRSSFARLGLVIHLTAGLIDPGFKGQITLEIFNVSRRPIKIDIGTRVAQIAFHVLTSGALHPYGSPALGSSYQDQEGPTVSAIRCDK